MVYEFYTRGRKNHFSPPDYVGTGSNKGEIIEINGDDTEYYEVKYLE